MQPELPKFLNRDLSWLEFNERVLQQAIDENHPLLERLKFLSIFTSNLDEFYMKRIGYLKRAILDELSGVGNDKASPLDLMDQCLQKIHESNQKRRETYSSLMKLLSEQSVQLLKWQDLTAQEVEIAKKYFHDNVFPILTPLAIDSAHPFPFLSNLSVSLGVSLQKPNASETLLARIKIPSLLPQWILLSEESSKNFRLLSLRDLIANNLQELFPEMLISSVMVFRVTRSADVELYNEENKDLVGSVEQELRLRRVADIVRVEYIGSTDNPFFIALKNELELKEQDYIPMTEDMYYHTLMELSDLPLPHLKFDSFLPVVNKTLSDDTKSIFDLIKAHDIAIHHPFESFNSSVERFLKEAVNDSNVVAIKMTLYRAGADSPLIPLLIRAAEKGKQVVCVVEVKARFDEQQNIYWGEILENAGVHVVYGIVGLKTHSKCILVMRREAKKFQAYCHIGTGNYNPKTAKLYTDFGLLSARKALGDELTDFFNYLTGLSLKKNYNHLLVSPINMRLQFKKLIQNEIQNAKQGKPARIIAKMNNMEDGELAMLLYEASQAGVKIDLIVRGFCCVRPKVKNLSENIRVVSIIGRFLEHSRIYYFANASENMLDGKLYIGSADWMYRNLDKRVEVLAPILEKSIVEDFLKYLNVLLTDTTQTWELNSDGKYKKILRKNSKEMRLHDYLIDLYGEKIKSLKKRGRRLKN